MLAKSTVWFNISTKTDCSNSISVKFTMNSRVNHETKKIEGEEQVEVCDPAEAGLGLGEAVWEEAQHCSALTDGACCAIAHWIKAHKEIQQEELLTGQLSGSAQLRNHVKWKVKVKSLLV